MMKRLLYGAALALAGPVLSACGGHAVSATSAGVTPPLSQPLADALIVAPEVTIADSYAGSIKIVEGSHTSSGTVKIMIKQTGRKISGAFDIKISTSKANLTLSGGIKSQTKTAAVLTFTIFNVHGRNAKAKATVTTPGLAGKATVPPQGTKPGVTITFNTKRT